MFKNNSYIKKTIKKPLVKRVKIDYKWILIVTIAAFFIAMIFSIMAELIMPNFGLTISLLILLFFVVLGIIFDLIGVAIMVADASQFHSMAAKKIRGAKLGLYLISKKERVATLCTDVVGDISGIMSGSAGVMVAFYLSQEYNFNQIITTVIVTAVIGAIIIGGKAMGKVYAANLSNYIVYEFAHLLSFVYKQKT